MIPIAKSCTEEALGYFIPGAHAMLMGQVKAALPDAIRALRATEEAGDSQDAAILEQFAAILGCTFNEWVLRSPEAIEREHIAIERLKSAEAEQLAELVKAHGISLVEEKPLGVDVGDFFIRFSNVPGPGRMSYRESMIDAGRGHLLRGDE